MHNIKRAQYWLHSIENYQIRWKREGFENLKTTTWRTWRNETCYIYSHLRVYLCYEYQVKIVGENVATPFSFIAKIKKKSGEISVHVLQENMHHKKI